MLDINIIFSLMVTRLLNLRTTCNNVIAVSWNFNLLVLFHDCAFETLVLTVNIVTNSAYLCKGNFFNEPLILI